MHDIDRTQDYAREFEFETDQEFESSNDEFENSFDNEFEAEFEAALGDGAQQEFEADEIDLASELMTASSEQELDQFLGRAFRRLRRRMLPGGITRALGGMLKAVAKRGLPSVAGALGNVALPGVGGRIGSALGARASTLFEVEEAEFGEGEFEFEVSRRFVRLTKDALQQAERAPQGADPRQVARAAVITAAMTHAPGLARALGGAHAGGGADARSHARSTRVASGDASSGRWMRRGDAIVLMGAKCRCGA